MTMNQTDIKFDERFLNKYAGAIVKDPVTAISELIANAWDAGATRVEIQWPDKFLEGSCFRIKDNGTGMTYSEFEKRWFTLSYNRLTSQGRKVEFPPGTNGSTRIAFGQNGLGRFASFHFSSSCKITSQKDGESFSCVVKRSLHLPIEKDKNSLKMSECDPGDHGTIIEGQEERSINIPSDMIRSEIGKRFLTDPSFKVSVNGEDVVFDDIPSDCLKEEEIQINEKIKVKITLIDAKKTDKSTKLHGIAWRVSGRLVGDCTWKNSDSQSFLDGRSSEAKRYTFIIQADDLKDCVLEDWSWFDDNKSDWQDTRAIVDDRIKEWLMEITEDERENVKHEIIQRNRGTYSSLGFSHKKLFKDFIDRIMREVPSLRLQQLNDIAVILANLELSQSKFGLLKQLKGMDHNDLDSLNQILQDWTVQSARLVLDDLKWRLLLIKELDEKANRTDTDEVQELQPLFERGLWMLGPEFDSIEFTSNKGMTTVIKEVFKKEGITGSRRRPDFVVMPDGSSTAFYSCPDFDENHNESGVRRVVVIDLKAPKIKVGEKEKTQVWGYVKEFKQKGLVTEKTSIDCFILGRYIDSQESGIREEDSGRVKIRPMLYSTVLERAKSRTLNLYTKLKNTPFLEDQDNDDLMDFLEEKQMLSGASKLSASSPASSSP